MAKGNSTPIEYQVTARKWRPLVFDDIVGQSHVATTLRNAIAANRLSHAYIFSGPRGVGKTTTARILAKAINCLHPDGFNPDNSCELCREITDGRSINVFEIDGASNRGVDEIRNLRESVRYAPTKGKYKVYIIDEVHMLTKEAFNALLKTLEEPPPSIIFIFATTEIHKVPLTILSRCQRFDFRRIAIEEIMNRLRFIAKQEKITIDDEALMLVAKRGDGSMRDAQSIFDQIVSFCGTKVTAKNVLSVLNIVDEEFFFRATDIMIRKETKDGLTLVDEIITNGYDIREFLTGLVEHLRNLLVVVTTGSTKLLEASDPTRKRYSEHAENFIEGDLLRLIRIASETEAAVRWSQQPRFKLEIGLVQMIKLDSSVDITQLLQQFSELKKRLNGGETGGGSSPQKRETVSPKPAILSETPVRGNVKASQPTLRPDQVVTPPPALLSLESRTDRIPVTENQSISSDRFRVQEPIAPAISTETALSRWPMLVDEARKKRIHVGTILSEASILGVDDNRLRVACPDDFHLDALTRNRQFITDLAQQVYGARIKLEAIVATVVAQQSPSPTIDEPATDSANETPDVKDHPVVQALMREFGAQQVE